MSSALPASRPKIVLLSLGGTIASAPATPGGGSLPTLTATDIVAGAPGAEQVAELVPVSFRQLPSSHLTLVDLVALAREIEDRFADGFDAAVVTQGTDTIEETAFALDLLVADSKAIVVTGAMRGPSILGAEGGANLLAAVRVAASPAARGLGTVVAMNDEVHAARWVQKTHTSNVAAFRSPMTGPIGWLAEEAVRIAVRPVGREPVALGAGAPADIALLAMPLGEDGRLIGRLAEAGYEGAVIEAMGGGHVTPSAAEALERCAATMPVVIASRSGAGETLRRTYGFVGSEIDLAARGVIFAGWLPGPKARLLLSFLMGAGVRDPRAIAAEFERRRELS
jgi:L-asparaginase